MVRGRLTSFRQSVHATTQSVHAHLGSNGGQGLRLERRFRLLHQGFDRIVLASVGQPSSIFIDGAVAVKRMNMVVVVVVVVVVVARMRQTRTGRQQQQRCLENKRPHFFLES